MSATSPSTRRFAGVETAPPDAILGLNEAYAADKHPAKMNLSVGVYKDASGQTPILRAVKEAERRLLEVEATKTYLPIDGIAEYRDHVRRRVFGEADDALRIAVLQTPGGTAALRLVAAFLTSQLPPLRIWLSNPTWANHASVFAAEGLAVESYRYLADDRTSFDFDGMLDDLNGKPSPGDAVLLHACCHNPTGVDPTPQQWSQIAALLAERGLLPVIDFAYQGFGEGLQEDAASIRTVLQACQEAIVCSSFSKNFGLYSERVGAVSVVTADVETAAAVQSQLKKLVRGNYSNPPQHGAAVVATILDDAELTKLWEQELTEMRERIQRLRSQFVETMKTSGRGHDFAFLLGQRGMFSYSGLTPLQVDRLKHEHSIYIVGSGRINVAGMSEQRMESLCSAVADVLES